MTLISERKDHGVVLIYPARAQEPEHEKVVLTKLGQHIAQLLGMEFGGDYDKKYDYDQRTYLIPTDTLIGAELPLRLGVHTEHDLYGGVAPHAFVPTKSITHPLFGVGAQAPEGWSHEFGRRISESVLHGYTAFNLGDATKAGLRMLEHGPVRIKPVLATAGRGQILATSAAELDRALKEQDAARLPQCGLVLEENLDDVKTFSVGQVRIGSIVASYVGTQRLTPDNNGEMVYGGSDLTVIRGGFDQLLTLKHDEPLRVAIEQARIYDTAAFACYPGLFASRRNYDIASGQSSAGQLRCGVLEQSWRTGGASAAEIAALQAFHSDPDLDVVCTSTIELFGAQAQGPSGATATFQGTDPDIGPISKYVMVKAYGDQ